MSYQCELVMHSISPRGKELLSYEITFPRSVLAEVVTHRILTMQTQDGEAGELDGLFIRERTALQSLSKNSASSRAIPFKQMVAAVANDPYIPEKWSKGGPGMQESGWIEDPMTVVEANVKWIQARDQMIEAATAMHNLGIHKQDVNRLLEPWGWVKQIISGTEWANFFALRTDKDAHPAFRRIARMMYLAKEVSTPKHVKYGEWHVPYVGQGTLQALAEKIGVSHSSPFERDSMVLQVSAARCAWVSYDPPGMDGFTNEKAFATYKKLMSGPLKHVSPVEHQGTPLDEYVERTHPNYRSNFSGWMQARKTIIDETPSVFKPTDEEVASWLRESPELAQYEKTLRIKAKGLTQRSS